VGKYSGSSDPLSGNEKSMLIFQILAKKVSTFQSFVEENLNFKELEANFVYHPNPVSQWLGEGKH